MDQQSEDRTDMLLEGVREAMDCLPLAEWRSLVRKAFANEDIEGVLWRGQEIPDHPDLKAALQQYREWKKLVADVTIPNGSAFGRGFWVELANASDSLSFVPGMDAAGRVYAENLMGEVISLFTRRERTEAEEFNNAGFEHHHAGGYKEALRLHNRAIEISPDYALAWVNKGIALKNLGRLDEAIECYDRVIEQMDTAFKKAWYNKGVALILRGERAEAIKCFEQALEIDPRYALARQMRDGCLREEQEGSANKLASHLPQDPQALQLLAMAVKLSSSGNWDAAVRLYEQALSHEPGNPALLVVLGEGLCECKRFEEAEMRLNEALERDEQLGAAWVNLARCYLNRGDAQGGLRAAENGVKYSPDDPMAWANHAAVLYFLERYDEALASARQSVELDSRHPFGLYYIGISLFYLGRHAEAREPLELLVEVAPGFPGVPNAREILSQIR
jgi:tetratricopeptide (TPR) repeat protein